MSDSDRTIFEIPAENYGKFIAECEKLSRKAVKLGFDPIKPMIFGHQEKKLSDGLVHKVYEILFTEEVIKIEGWTFVATIDHSQEIGNIVRTNPNLDVVLPNHFRTAAPVCDHCKVKRYRRDSYVLHCDGEFKQVGKSCMKSFFGHDPYRIIRMAEILGYAAECARGWCDLPEGGNQLFVHAETFANYCAAMIRQNGWVSKKTAYETGRQATATSAMNVMCDQAATAAVTDADRELASRAMDWADALKDRENKSDYEHNISVLAGSTMIETRSIGLFASIVGVYAMKVARESTERCQKAANTPSQHLGTIGERIVNLPVTVVGHLTKANDFGTTHIYKMMNEGKELVWFASRDQKLNVDDKLILAGTVTKHGEYNNVKNTTVNRCKLVKA